VPENAAEWAAARGEPEANDATIEDSDRIPAEEVGIRRPLFSPPPPLAEVGAFTSGIESAVGPLPADTGLDDDVEAIVTRLLVRPPLDPGRLGEFRGALEELPGVMRTEPQTTAEPSGPLLVTHAADTSLLGSLLAIPGLDFRLISRGADYLEIEVLEVSLSSR
jgi:hypothetical protein